MHGQRGGGGGTGGSVGAGGFVPSAALLRAVLINGAQDMSKKGGRLGSKGARLLPAPSMEIGFGRVNLLKSLRVPNADGTGKLQCMRPEATAA